MEGQRRCELAAPTWAAPLPAPAARSAPGAAGIYMPKGWKCKCRRQGSDDQGPSKRRKRAAAAASAAAQPALQPCLVPPPPRTAPNPAQLAPLQCPWPHSGALHLLAQQAWPAMGVAALVQRAASPAAGVLPWWDRMLPALSLSHPPLDPDRQLLLQAASSSGCASVGGMTAELLPQPGVLVGYEDDWLEVPPQVLPMWQATPLAPFGGAKALLHCLVCPEPQLAQAQQLVKDVGALFEACCLGSHAPASGASAVHAFSLRHPAGGAAGEAAAAAGRQPPLAARYLAGLRQACEQLQRRLLLDPPVELQEGVGASLEDGGEPALVVYLVCPLEQPADQVAALLEAAACLAPCTLLGADAGGVAGGLCLDSPGGEQQQAQLEPSAPQQPDRPAGATPAADNSRAPGGSPPPDELEEEEEEEGELEGQPGAAGAGGRQVVERQAAEQQRYHGAASVLHERQQGDFRRLPVLQLQRPEGSRPSNIVLQLLTAQALADLTGTAARCTAFAVYSKAQRQVQPGSPLADVALETGAALPPSLPFCSQPLVALASAGAEHSVQDVQQPAACQPQQAGSEAGLQQRTLHCCYARPPAGSTLLPLAFTDSCGELVHAELLDSAACGMGPGALGDSSSSGGAAAVGSAQLHNGGEGSSGSSASAACRLVLQRCAELLSLLQAASGTAGVLRHITISAVGMQPVEREAWQQLLERNALQQLGLPEGACASVVQLQALPPARFAGPDPPSGCLLLMGQQEGSQQQQALVAWLPPGSGSSSLLPQEHDTVRQLEVSLVAHTHLPRGGAQPLKAAAQELHALAWLHAAHQGACLRTLAGGGQPAPADAHLPLHAALATQLRGLLGHACAVAAGRT